MNLDHCRLQRTAVSLNFHYAQAPFWPYTRAIVLRPSRAIGEIFATDGRDDSHDNRPQAQEPR
ncbi:hypothetical protein KP05_12865 [Cobetia amphilecti]|nr:hypothetical protein KP05_12865 [Cobetia amphilecti]